MLSLHSTLSLRNQKQHVAAIKAIFRLST